MKRNLSQNLTQDDTVQIERGKFAMNELWSLFCNKEVWKVSKVTVSFANVEVVRNSHSTYTLYNPYYHSFP